MSPRSAAVPTENSVAVVFTRPDPIGIVFDECEDARDGERYLVVNSVHPGTQAAELMERTADASGAEGAALIRPGMVVQKINGGERKPRSTYRHYTTSTGRYLRNYLQCDRLG